MKIEMHCHTKEGSKDSVVSLEKTIDILVNKGYDGIVVTDHNSYAGFNSKEGLDIPENFIIFKGVEYDTSDAGHMLIILPKQTQASLSEQGKPVEEEIFTHRGMSVRDTINIVKNLGGIIGPAHPFDYYKLGILNNARIMMNKDILNEFDFIESFNACGSKLGNHKSTILAEALKKPGFGGSDSHRVNSVGFSATILPEFVRSESELIDLVKTTKHTHIKAEGKLFKGTSKEKLGPLYSLGLHAFYGANSATNRFTRRHAVRTATLLGLV